MQLRCFSGRLSMRLRTISMRSSCAVRSSGLEGLCRGVPCRCRQARRWLSRAFDAVEREEFRHTRHAVGFDVGPSAPSRRGGSRPFMSVSCTMSSCFGSVERDAERKPIEYVLKGSISLRKLTSFMLLSVMTTVVERVLLQYGWMFNIY